MKINREKIQPTKFPFKLELTADTPVFGTKNHHCRHVASSKPLKPKKNSHDQPSPDLWHKNRQLPTFLHLRGRYLGSIKYKIHIIDCLCPLYMRLIFVVKPVAYTRPTVLYPN
ncbi:hypothetical protein KKI24_14135 [bacterium]|nr:hypothetical protein [bacterium]